MLHSTTDDCTTKQKLSFSWRQFYSHGCTLVEQLAHNISATRSSVSVLTLLKVRSRYFQKPNDVHTIWFSPFDVAIFYSNLQKWETWASKTISSKRAQCFKFILQSVGNCTQWWRKNWNFFKKGNVQNERNFVFETFSSKAMIEYVFRVRFLAKAVIHTIWYNLIIALAKMVINF